MHAARDHNRTRSERQRRYRADGLDPVGENVQSTAHRPSRSQKTAAPGSSPRRHRTNHETPHVLAVKLTALHPSSVFHSADAFTSGVLASICACDALTSAFSEQSM